MTTSETRTVLLSVNEVQVAYRSSMVALRGVSMDVPLGGIVAILGPNGAGKSTLVRTVGGSLRFYAGAVTAGSVTLGGTGVTNASAHQLARQGVAVVPEGRGLFPHLTVEENLRTGGVSRSRRESLPFDRIYELFPGLHRRRRVQAGWLSGGEQQQLAVGRALMSSPQLLVLDEPSLGLAPIMVKRMMEELIQINAEAGVSLLIAEQNAAMALTYVRYAYVLEEGVVRVQGPADVLRDDPSVAASYLAGRGRDPQVRPRVPGSR